MERLEEKTRKIDELGRIVIPIEVREYLKINAGDSIKITVKENNIVLIKERCSFGRNYKTFSANKRKKECDT